MQAKIQRNTALFEVAKKVLRSDRPKEFLKMYKTFGEDLKLAIKTGNQVEIIVAAAENRTPTQLNILKNLGVHLEAKERSFGRTALHIAAKAGNEKAVLMLLYCGLDPNCRSTDKQTPSDMARMGRHTEIVVLFSDFVSLRGLSRDFLSKYLPHLVNGHTEIDLSALESDNKTNLVDPFPFWDLPRELCTSIIDCLPMTSICSTYYVSKEWQKMVKERFPYLETEWSISGSIKCQIYPTVLDCLMKNQSVHIAEYEHLIRNYDWIHTTLLNNQDEIRKRDEETLRKFDANEFRSFLFSIAGDSDALWMQNIDYFDGYSDWDETTQKEVDRFQKYQALTILVSDPDANCYFGFYISVDFVASISKFALERRKNRIRQTKKLRVNAAVPSDALIDAILPQEIIMEIIKYDLSVATRCRGVNKYWRSLISDQDLEHLVVHRFEYGRDLLKGVLPDRERFNKYFHEEPFNLTEERIRNVCAAEKSGKFFVEIKNTNLFDELRAIKNETDLLNKFIVQTIGTIIPDLSNENHTYYDRNCILLDTEDEKYYLPRPNSMPLPRLGVGSVKLIFDLGEFLNSDLTNRDHQNTLRVLGWQVFDPLIWTLGIFANEMAVIAPMASLLILTWICSYITPMLPSWNIYTTIIAILILFLATSNKIHKPLLLRQMAATFWLIVTVGSCHWINATNIFYMPIYEAIGNLIWTVVFYSYTEFGAKFLKNQNLDPTRKIYVITCIVIAIFTSLVVSNSTRDNELSLIGIVLLWQNIKYLCGTVIYLLMTARIFRINFQETDTYKKLAATYFGSFGSFVTKFGIALVLRLAYQTVLDNRLEQQ